MPLRTLAFALGAVVALLHVGFLVMEMFLWTRPVGLKVFRIDAEYARRSRVLAANQGLYNGILAAGLGWGTIAGRDDVLGFFLASAVVAGVYGGLTAGRNILYVQAAPAAVALLLLLAS